MFFIHKREEDCKWIMRLEASAGRNEPNNPLAVFLTPNFDSPTVAEKARGNAFQSERFRKVETPAILVPLLSQFFQEKGEKAEHEAAAKCYLRGVFFAAS